MAVYVDVYWFYSDNGVMHSIDHIKISDTISYNHYRDVYQNLRFDDYYLIDEATDKIFNYIKNSSKHKCFDARVVEDFLPNISIEAKDYS